MIFSPTSLPLLIQAWGTLCTLLRSDRYFSVIIHTSSFEYISTFHTRPREREPRVEDFAKMAIIDNTYDMNEDIDDLEEQSENAGAANFVAARDYMLNLLKGRGIAASLMGGYSLLMRGSPRITLDIDIGVRARIKDLDEKVKGDPRQVHFTMRRPRRI